VYCILEIKYKMEWKGKVTFLETNARRQTDARFDEMANEEHHLGVN